MVKKRGPAKDQIQLVSAAARAFSVLEHLSAYKSQGLEELSRELGLAKPTVYRFLQTLQELGYVRRDHEDRWAMSLKLFTVGSRALDHLDLYAAARPVAEELAEELGETIHMAVLDERSAVYVLKIESRYTIRMYSRVGRRVPLYCTAIGKVLLANAAPAELDEHLIGVRFVPFTAHTLSGRSAFEAELVRVRAEGFARDVEEHEEGIICLAAPVYDYRGKVLAALSASWPRFRYERNDEAALVSAVKEAAARISAILGYAS